MTSWQSKARRIFLLALAAFAGCVCLQGQAVAQIEGKAKRKPTFQRDVAPILKTHCFQCHGERKRESELDLRRRFTLERGGVSGATIVRGKASESLLIEMIQDGLMPPEGKPRVAPAQLELLRHWVDSGAAIDGLQEDPLPSTTTANVAAFENARRHWAFQPVRPIEPPPVQRASWVRSPIDAFTLAKLEQRKWRPAPEATKIHWLRRVYFDLIGLPPHPDAVAAFLHDDSPAAYETVVDRLLDSNHYGERWAQHWLDVVRFAETEGFEYDRHLPDAWRYRDYVIQSLNSDKPFDRFVMEQIAGDELALEEPASQSPSTQELAENRSAGGSQRTGDVAAIFHRLGAVRRNAGNPDIALSRNEVLTERTNIIGEAFLGLTVGCARCHNHKLEPITQKDYYRFQAYLAATAEHNISLVKTEEQESWNRHNEKIQKQLKSLKQRLEAAKGSQKQELQHKLDKLNAEVRPPPPTIPSIRNDFANRTPIHVLRRGVWELKGVAVGPRPLSVLVSAQEPELAADTERPRTQLAHWIANKNNPLTARVIVNRIWQHHFGVGLVKTANDFGTRGAPPSHPQLLDWLAQEIVGQGWRLKPLHRLIVLSNTYRQASRSPRSTEYAASDPENRLLWRFSRRRLSAEEIRDAMLFVSGKLNSKAGGPSVMVPVDSELISLLYKPSQWRPAADVTEHDRRSVYLIAKRNLRLPFMQAFDAPTLQSSCSRRGVSTHAPQALELLNGRLANQLAQAFAERLERECQGPKQTVERAYQLACARSPSARELALSVEFLRDQPLSEFTLAILNLSELIYVQ